MAKKYKGKKCPYCEDGVSDSDEHVFARKFFAVEDRDKLPKAPACKICNGRKADLERYALEVLPFGARHHAARATMETEVPRRLAKNQAHFRKMKEAFGRVFVQEKPDGLFVPTRTVPVDADRLKSLFEYIVKGLLWYHWKTYLGSGNSVQVMFLTQEGDRRFYEQFAHVNGEVVERDLGRGTVRYFGIRDNSPTPLTVWHFSILGGVSLAGGDSEDGVSRTIGGFTGPEVPIPQDGLWTNFPTPLSAQSIL